jgi:exopolysaccharide biosynthesis protein
MILYQIQNPTYVNTVPDDSSKSKSGNGSREIETNENDLVIKLESIEKRYSSAYFYEGKVLEISNPLNVKLISSNMENHGEQIFTIAESANALAAINASGFGDANGRGNGGSATGVVIEAGVIKNNDTNTQHFVAAITGKGNMFTGRYSANELIDLDVQFAAGFKPQLIADGKKMVEGDGGWGVGPRSAIGQKADGTIVMVVIDGRQPSRSIGATIKEVQDIMYERGVVNAMAMDGGSSSSMYFNSENITTPSSRNNIPRYLPNIWAVVPDEGQHVEVYIDGEQVDMEMN